MCLKKNLTKSYDYGNMSDSALYAEKNIFILDIRVAGLGRLSAGAKMAMKPFVKSVFTIFATNASFLSVISNFRI